MREAPSVEIVGELLKLDARVKVYDPVAMHNFKAVINSPHIEWCSDALEAAKDCGALCLLTEWDEFYSISRPNIRRGEEPVTVIQCYHQG